MIRKKYDIVEGKYDNMDPAARYKDLKRMLEKENIIIFPTVT